MLEELSELELALLYRAVNTERNLIISKNLPLEQLDAISNVLDRLDKEYTRRYEAKNARSV